jgi:glycerol kinase
MSQYILAIDQGTTGTTVLILDEQLQILAKENQEFTQIYPQPGWVEHDPEAIWQSVLTALQRAIAVAQIDPQKIGCIGITNQRETTVLWDRETGKPIYNAIVWQDRRTTALCDALKAQGLEPLFRQRTGLVLDPYFSGTKIRWLLDNIDGLRSQAQAGKLAFGTIDSYLIWRLTNAAVHATDGSNASRTLFFNLHTLQWDPELLYHLQIPESILPQIHSSAEQYGTTQGVPGLPDGIPITGVAGDQQAALFGQTCFQPGDAKCTYGTGAFLLLNIGPKPIFSQQGLLTTMAWQIGDQVSYALEGSAFIAGAAVQWLRDGLKLVSNAAEIETLAQQVPDSGGVIFVPALVGLGAPHWRPHARGIISGITRGTTAAHLARATLEGIGFQIYDLVHAACADWRPGLSSFKVDGGAAANNLLLQFQADILDKEIIRPKIIETTSLGAALLAGLGKGLWQSFKEISDIWQVETRFQPNLNHHQREDYLLRWARAIQLT